MGIFMVGWMWQFQRFRSRPDRLFGAGKFFTQDLKVEPPLLRRSDVMLELGERGGGAFEGGAVPRIKSGIVEL
jgi:hypothetical protein